MAKGSLFKTTGVRPKGFKFPVGNITANAVSESDSFFDSTGGTKTYSGDWVIHTFTTSGTFKDFSSSIGHECEYLIVSGGGAGGSGVAGGGGGAGGVLYGLTMPVVKGKEYSIIIGAGGDARISPQYRASGANGSNSSIGTFTFEDGDAPFGGIFPGNAPSVPPAFPTDGTGTCIVPGGGGGGTYGADPYSTNPQYGLNPQFTNAGFAFYSRGLSGGSGGGSASAPVDYPGGPANLGAPTGGTPPTSPYFGLADVEPNSQSTEGYTSPSTSAVNIGAGGGINSRYLTGGPFPNGLGWGNALGDAAGGGGGGACGGGGSGRIVGLSPDIGNTPQVSPIPGNPPQSPANPSIGGMGITLSISGSSATYGGGGGGGMSTFPKNDPGPHAPGPVYGTYDGVNPWPDDFGTGGRGQSGGGNGGAIHPLNDHRPDGGPGIYSPTQYSPPIANGGNGSANRGGGGGGGGGIPPYGAYNQSSSGGAGGSGIVIIRYNKANEAFKVI